mmetsp:Transcript_21213/g.45294  ORF Transcript_21213/g.45294 Transcript_21213/m.45294 type:complete len:355 (-) Transcript_21213:93-1157(-)
MAEAGEDTGSELEHGSEEEGSTPTSMGSEPLFFDFSPRKRAMLKRMTWDPWALEGANERFRGDRDVVLEAVKFGGWALQWANKDVRSNPDIVREVVQLDGHALQWATAGVRGNKEVVMEAVTNCGRALEWANDKLRADREVVIAAVQADGFALAFASEDLQGDKEILMMAARARVCDVARMYFSLSRAAQAILDREDYIRSLRSAIAVRGERAPVVTVSLSHVVDSDGRRFCCDAVLMSGATFVCHLTYRSSSNRRETARSCPILNDLAEKLVAEIPKHSALTPARVFINFVINSEDGDTQTATPWESERPLSDFLPPSGRGPPQRARPRSRPPRRGSGRGGRFARVDPRVSAD